jgi:hypothetical protein
MSHSDTLLDTLLNPALYFFLLDGGRRNCGVFGLASITYPRS